ncbi:MAG: hypothetical protein C1943_02325 [Halochromatium sp.]|nr:hypothetical protein [Halochromatium sp.]
MLDSLQVACRRLLGHRHAKTNALAVELLNDWEAIFRVLENPHWPITNNAAYAARGISGIICVPLTDP